MSRFRKFFIEAWDDVLVWILTFLGVLLARVYPYFSTMDKFNVEMISLPRLFIAAALALMLVLKSESDAPTPAGQVAASAEARRQGKRQALFRRLSGAMSQGFMYSSLIN